MSQRRERYYFTVNTSRASRHGARSQRFVGVFLATLLTAVLVTSNTSDDSFQAFSVGDPSVSLPEAQTFATAGTFFDVVPAGNGSILSGFTGNVRAVVGVDVGSLRIGNSSSYNGSAFTLTVGSATVDVPFGYRSSAIASAGAGAADLAFEGAIADVNTVLAELQFSRVQGSSTLSVSAVKAGDSGTIAYDPVTEHYYEFVDAATDPMWRDARCEAKFLSGAYDAASTRFDKCSEANVTPRTFNGYTGYLATITSSAENTFVAAKAGSAAAWIGGSDMAITRLEGSSTNIAAAEQTWRWTDGPEAGLVFWKTGCVNDGSEVTCTVAGVDSTTRYSYWNANEPNGGSGNEEALQLLAGGTGKWNDLPEDSSRLPHIIEYGGISGETATEQVARTVALNVAQDGPPTAVTGSAGDQKVTVAWTAPVIVTSATVTSYTATSTPGSFTCVTTATSCVVSGLTNGTAYTFVVRVTYSDSNTRDSSASDATTPVYTAPAPEPEASSGVATPAAATPTPASTAVVAEKIIPAPVSGPVLRGSRGPVLSPVPTATVGGRPVNSTTTVESATRTTVLAGGVTVGVSVPANKGRIVTGSGGATEVALEKGSAATISGSGVLPNSMVQVFLPLAGGNARELARIPSTSEGSFDGSAPLSALPNAAPLPVGKQVLQIVSVGATGEQTVVEMTVSIAQSTPQPETERGTENLPEPGTGGSLATNAGVPEAVVITGDKLLKLAVVGGDGWSMSVAFSDQQSGVTPIPEGGATLTAIRGSTATVSGGGMMPGTRAEAWLFSTPVLLGTVTVGDDGTFDSDVLMDSLVIAVGSHTLQIQGIGIDGYTRAVNLGVDVIDPQALSPDESAQSLLVLSLWLLLAAVLIAAAFAWINIVRSRARRA